MAPVFDIFSRCGNSSVGRARPCQGRGRGSESRFPLQWRGSKAVMPRIANPFRPVRLRSTPPSQITVTAAQVVKLVDTRDLKSLGSDSVSVRPRPRAPYLFFPFEFSPVKFSCSLLPAAQAFPAFPVTPGSARPSPPKGALAETDTARSDAFPEFPWQKKSSRRMF